MSTEREHGERRNPERDGNSPQRNIHTGCGDPIIGTCQQARHTDNYGEQRHEGENHQGRYAKPPAVEADRAFASLMDDEGVSDEEVYGTAYGDETQDGQQHSDPKVVPSARRQNLLSFTGRLRLAGTDRTIITL